MSYVVGLVVAVVVSLALSVSAAAADLTETVIVLKYKYYKTTWAHMQVVVTDKGHYIRKHKNDFRKGPADISYIVDEKGVKHLTYITFH